MKIEVLPNTYKPRSGSAGVKAIQALLDGPMSSKELGPAIGVPPEDVNANLAAAVKGHAIGKVQDENGVLHFALPGMEIDDKFKPYIGRRANDPNPDDPFGLVAQAAAARQARINGGSQLGQAARNESSAPQAAKPATAPAAPAEKTGAPLRTGLLAETDDFVAGLMSNGELQIAAGNDRITLSSANTGRLVGYLEKVAGLL